MAIERKTEGNKFLILEKEIMWKIFGPTKDNVTGEWGLRKNRELEVIYNEKNILKNIEKVYDEQVKTHP